MKICITGDAYTLTSDISVNDITLLKRYNPEALQIKDENGNVKFAVDYAEGKPQTAPFCIVFGGFTRDEEKKATATGALPAGMNTNEQAKEYVAEIFGKIIANLKAMETTIPAEAAKISGERKALIESIDIA